MWKTFTAQEEIFMIKIEHDDVNDKIKVNVSNLKDIWWNSSTLDELMNMFEKHNPRFEATKGKLLDLVLNLPENIQACTMECNLSDDVFNLVINSVVSTIKVKYEFVLRKSSDTEFTDKILYPMIYTLKYLEDQNKMLANLLQKKDRELEEYKLEHGEITRKDLITNPYTPNEDECKNEKLILNVYGQSEAFWNRFLTLSGTSNIQLSNLKKDPWNHQKKKRKTYSKDTKKTKGFKFK